LKRLLLNSDLLLRAPVDAAPAVLLIFLLEYHIINILDALPFHADILPHTRYCVFRRLKAFYVALE
jgi:hypothetical protein